LVGTRDEMQMKPILLYYCWSSNLVDLLEAMRGTDRAGESEAREADGSLHACNAMLCHAMRDGGTCMSFFLFGWDCLIDLVQ
jgi:hypothetical protein